MPQGYSDCAENILDYNALCALFIARATQGAESRLEDAWRQIELREQATGPEVPLTLPRLRAAYGLDEMSYFLAFFALACETDGVLLDKARGLCGGAPTFALAFSLFSAWRPCPMQRLFSLCLPPASPLTDLLLFEEGEAAGLQAPLRLRREALYFLACANVLPGPGCRLDACLPPPALPLYPGEGAALAAYAAAARAGESGAYLFLTGAPGGGKKSLVRRLGAGLGTGCLLAEAGAGGDGHALALAARLTGAPVCVTGYAAGQQAALLELVRHLPPRGVPLIVLCDSPAVPPPEIAGRAPLCRVLPPLTGQETAALWEHFCTGVPAGPGARARALTYRLVPGQMAAVWERARFLRALQGPGEVDAGDIAAAVAQFPAAGGYMRVLKTGYTLGDLVLEAGTARRLEMICAFAKGRAKVREEWGFGEKDAYGLGVTALLCGAPGTGKTMAACAIANELGMRLLRVDLSQIVDKYIGETEKRLASVFQGAAGSNGVLFFDEADALFTKRTEVSSANDRYANLETAYLLQSIEEYDGIVLLATNLVGNFDEAFLRRIRIVARFSLPNEAQRLQLWRRAFPPGTPLEAKEELPLLAREWEVSPAVIRGAALTAAMLAATAGESVRLPHILDGIRNELDKGGQSLKTEFLEGF